MKIAHNEFQLLCYFLNFGSWPYSTESLGFSTEIKSLAVEPPLSDQWLAAAQVLLPKVYPEFG